MVAKLSTTIEKMKNLPNSSNSITLNEFLFYMKNNGSSERHQNNNLIVMIEFSNSFGSNTSFYDIYYDMTDEKRRCIKIVKNGDC
jgi:hypothetical protein